MNKKIILLVTVILMSFTCTVYAVEPYLNTQLLEAASVGDADAVKDALYNGADVDARDRLGNTALILAADGGYQEVVRLLIAYKASVNAVNKFGYTPLMSAVTNSHRYIASLLIKAGADPKLPNKYGTTPEMYIKAQGFFTMNEYISDEKPVITSRIDDRPARRGSMAAIHSAPWREEFNQLISLGKTNEAAELLVGYANTKNPEACYLLGTLFLSKGNTEQGIFWVKQAAALGDSMMKYRAAKSIIDNGAGAGMKEAIAMLKESIAEGNNFAKTEYAKALLFGNGVPKDNANAYALFKDASSYDLPEAVYYTGMLEYLGRGTVKDETKGSAKIQMAADMGFYEAEQFIDKLNYTIGSAWNNAYKISKVQMCYPGDGTVNAEFILGEAIDNVEFSYLKGLYPTAKFSMPSIHNEIPVKEKPDEISAFDLGLSSDNNTQDNISVQDNNSDSKTDIDFSKPVSIDNKSSKN